MKRSMAMVMLLGLALAGCGSGSEPAATASVDAAPTIAPTMPAAASDPAATARLLTFAGRDADRDGFVSSVENAAAADNIFDAIDADQDGVVSDQEYTAARVALGFTSLPGSEELIAQADQDGDGKLTLAEWIASESRAFKAADRNGDGRLDSEEWNALPRLVGTRPDKPLSGPSIAQ